ncbi:MAG TPA: IgGFc-binding protein, partial [Polyangiaceae bacterium]|nr:IgGFc-binding protein [Polyangiaceae bacterium]
MLEKSPYCLLFTFLLGACASNGGAASPSGTGGTGGGSPPVDAGAVCPYGQTVCEGNVAKVCDGQGGYSSTVTCATECKDGLGCVTCVPNASSCASLMATVCDATGTNESTFACTGPGMSCDADGCHGECSPASLGMGYQGCEFWPTVTPNPVWAGRAGDAGPTGGFHFGVLIGNVSSTNSASVTISGPGTEQSFTLDASESRAVTLDWVPDLKGPDWEVPYQPGNPTQSVKKAGGAYRVVSNRPITVYQLNSLENEIPDVRGCPSVAGASANCFSYSTDGSLLLPAHVLSSHYVVAGFHAWHKDFATLPGPTSGRLNMGDFISITALQAGTEVTVQLRPNQGVLSGPDLPRPTAENAMIFTMAASQVVQLFTPGTTRSDSFSGTDIKTKDGKPVQVLSGVGCVNIFEDESPCGHIEDSVLPYDALGKDYVVPMLATGSTADAGTPIAQMIRVQSVADGTAITFEPKGVVNSVTLSRGATLDVNLTTDMRISSPTPFAVTHYLSGRSVSSRMSESIGSPNQLTVAPVVQFRTSYAFVVPSQQLFATNYLTIIAPTGAAVSLDAQAVAREKFLAVGASGMSVARVPVVGATRVHTLTSDKAVGIVVFGIG